MAEDSTITIKKGGIVLTMPRSELIDVSETHDGIAFNFKGGLQLYYTNNFMQQGTKQIIKNTADSFTGKKIIFNLDDPKKPAMVDAT